MFSMDYFWVYWLNMMVCGGMLGELWWSMVVVC